MDVESGEVLPAVLIETPKGSSITTPAQKEKQAELFKKKRQKAKEHFFFVNAGEQFSDLKPATVARLLYLNTFTQHGSNCLMLSERKPMKYVDLGKTLGIAEGTVASFWREVFPKYIQRDGDNLLFTDRGIFIRGKLERGKFTPYQRFLFDGIKKLYRSTPVTEHKRLGEIFQLLPYINFEFNLICKPESVRETDLDKVQLLTAAEYCKLIHYDVSHLDRLMRCYQNLRFPVGGKNGRREKFCSFVCDGIDKPGAKIIINPRILYCGSDKRRVEILGLFCRD